MDIHTSLIWIIIFFNGTFEYDDGETLKLLRWMQNLHQSVWDHEILYADRSSVQSLNVACFEMRICDNFK
jgi:hypothetical protein